MALASLGSSKDSDQILVELNKLDQKAVDGVAELVGQGVNYADWTARFGSKTKEYKDELQSVIDQMQRQPHTASLLFSALVRLYAKVGHEVETINNIRLPRSRES